MTGIVDCVIVSEIMAGVIMATPDSMARKSTRAKSVTGKSVCTQRMTDAQPVTHVNRTVGGKTMEAPAAHMKATSARMKPATTADVKAARPAFRDRRDIHRDAKRAYRNACRENCYRSLHGVS